MEMKQSQSKYQFIFLILLLSTKTTTDCPSLPLASSLNYAKFTIRQKNENQIVKVMNTYF